MSNSYIARNQIFEKETHLIHNNGFRPFQVIVTARNIIILACDAELDEDDDDTGYSFFIAMIDEFEGYWYGFDSSPNRAHRNTLLVKLSNHKYMHIGPVIYTFKTTDRIIDYISYVGNSDVPYPVAYGKSNIYLMNEFKYADKEYLREATVANAIAISADFADLDLSQTKEMRRITLIAESQGLEITKY